MCKRAVCFRICHNYRFHCNKVAISMSYRDKVLLKSLVLWCFFSLSTRISFPATPQFVTMYYAVHILRKPVSIPRKVHWFVCVVYRLPPKMEHNFPCAVKLFFNGLQYVQWIVPCDYVTLSHKKGPVDHRPGPGKFNATFTSSAVSRLTGPLFDVCTVEL